MTIKRDNQQDFIEYCSEQESYDGLTIELAQKLRYEVRNDKTLNKFFDDYAENYGLPMDCTEAEERDLYWFIKENFHRIVAWCKAEAKDGTGDDAWEAAKEQGLPDRWWENEEGCAV